MRYPLPSASQIGQFVADMSNGEELTDALARDTDPESVLKCFGTGAVPGLFLVNTNSSYILVTTTTAGMGSMYAKVFDSPDSPTEAYVVEFINPNSEKYSVYHINMSNHMDSGMKPMRGGKLFIKGELIEHDWPAPTPDPEP